MSRNIKDANTRIQDNELVSLREDSNGKLLFTSYRQHDCAFLIKDNRLVAVQVLPEGSGNLGAVYIGKVKNVVHNIDACFVEIADGEICFLSLKDSKYPYLLNRAADGRILQGDELPVQIIREAHKTKQCSVTTRLSLSNDYFAVSVGSERVNFSHKLLPETRQQLDGWLKNTGLVNNKGFLCPVEELCNLLDISLPIGPNPLPPIGFVVRTKAGECTRQMFLDALKQLFTEFLALFGTALHRTCFHCLLEAPNACEVILDKMVYPWEYQEIVTDNTDLFQCLQALCEAHTLDKKVRLYQDDSFSLDKLYSLDSKMSTALEKRVWLKSGGYLVIEQTEAMTVIDVNSGKYEARRPSSDTAWLINREAAEETAIQLRLRNLSGIIVVDFVNMNNAEKEKALIEYCKQLVSKDKIMTSVVDITALGLMEITRKKQNKTLKEQLAQK